jgi:hypothetical protein
VAGVDSPGAKINAFFTGLEYELPESKGLTGFAEAIGGVDHFFGQIFHGKNYGVIDHGPVEIEARLAGDFSP